MRLRSTPAIGKPTMSSFIHRDPVSFHQCSLTLKSKQTHSYFFAATIFKRHKQKHTDTKLVNPYLTKE